mmetsp:Transcript_33175/g.91421  ORF Transcript_33175/g.91421 Transcript_33175/m.91421 type:complete len:210 (+) Transcript_33175:520-1149(+)
MALVSATSNGVRTAFANKTPATTPPNVGNGAGASDATRLVDAASLAAKKAALPGVPDTMHGRKPRYKSRKRSPRDTSPPPSWATCTRVFTVSNGCKNACLAMFCAAPCRAPLAAASQGGRSPAPAALVSTPAADKAPGAPSGSALAPPGGNVAAMVPMPTAAMLLLRPPVGTARKALGWRAQARCLDSIALSLERPAAACTPQPRPPAP